MNLAEQKIACYFNRAYCYLTGSATSAMYLFFKTLKQNNGAVLFPAITCMAPVNAALYAGLSVTFCDINLQDYTIDISSLKNRVKQDNILAIVPTHIYGHNCDIDNILSIAKKNGIAVLEDAAQAVGGLHNEMRVGSFGDASVVSFGHSKILDCGGGGALLTDDIALYSEVSKLGKILPLRPESYDEQIEQYRAAYYSIYGLMEYNRCFNDVMLELQLNLRDLFVYAIDRVIEEEICHKLDQLENLTIERRIRKNLYDKFLDKRLFDVPVTNSGSACWRYCLLYKYGTKQLISKIRSVGIDVSNWYMALNNIYCDDLRLPNAEYLEEHIINFWVMPSYSENKIISDINIINSILEQEQLACP